MSRANAKRQRAGQSEPRDTHTRLLARREAAERLGLHPKSFDTYWRAQADLLDAVVRLRVRKQGRGCYRWPDSCIEAHIQRLLHGTAEASQAAS